MSVTLYPGGDNPVTPNLGLALWDMSMTMAENFELLDSAVAATTVTKRGWKSSVFSGHQGQAAGVTLYGYSGEL
jgi:hypothetical protein